MPVHGQSANYWGKRGGSCSKSKVAKASWKWGCFFKQKKWGTNYNGNSNSKPKTVYKLLVENAKKVGYVNGVKIARKR